MGLADEIRGSQLWQRIERHLRNRREAMLLADATTDADNWKQRGAVRELTFLLNLPMVLEAEEALAREQVLRDPTTLDVLDPDKDTLDA